MAAPVSFELFPPRSAQAQERWWATLERLAQLNPSFVSVTCGAGGSGVDITIEMLRAITSRTTLNVAGHLTCAGRTREQVDEAIAGYWEAGVRHIVALRGDVPDGGQFLPSQNEYRDSVQLIAAIRAAAPFEVSVATYPERHPDSRSPAKDLAWLARKAEAGATRAITQFSFDTDAIVRLRDKIDRAGVDLKLVPGILPTTNFAAVRRMARQCQVKIPGWLESRFAGLEDDPQMRMMAAAIVAAEQVGRLRREGFAEFHFYTLNSYDVVGAVCRLLDVRPAELEAVAA
jgi:methylenetetrahydrofolate reductase (NADPH)